MPKLLTALAILTLSVAGFASAEQYVITTKFNNFQPAQFLVSLNGKTLLLHRNADGNADITPWAKTGKNTLLVEVTPGKNSNQFSKSVLTLGAGAEGKWHTLYKKEVGKNTQAGKSTFVFMAKPSSGQKPGNVNLFGKFNSFQPVDF